MPAGAAIKADGYGLGARETMDALLEAGCRDFFVSTWAEAEALGKLPETRAWSFSTASGPTMSKPRCALGAALPQHGRTSRAVEGDRARPRLRRDDRHRHQPARPAADRDRRARRPRDRHAAQPSRLRRRGPCAQRDAARTLSRGRRGGAGAALQPRQFRRHLPWPRLQLRSRPAGPVALSAAFPRPEAEGNIRQVARVEAQIVQRRTIRAGESCGYGATFIAEEDTEAAILNIGYADGYLRGFSSHGSAFAGEFALPVLGRVSMDLIAVGCDAAPGLKEGEWVEIDYDLPSASKQSGLSQYELLTTLGERFERRWV